MIGRDRYHRNLFTTPALLLIKKALKDMLMCTKSNTL